MKLFEIKSEDPLTKPRRIRVLTLSAAYVSQYDEEEHDEEEHDGYDLDGYRGAGFELETYQYNNMAECFNDMPYVKNVFSKGWVGDNSNKVRNFINHHTHHQDNDANDFSDSLPEKYLVDIGVFVQFSKGKQTFEWTAFDDEFITAFDGIEAQEVYELAMEFFK